MTPSDSKATTQLAQAVEYWLDRLATHGIISHDPLRDPRRYAEEVIAELTSGDEHLAAEAALTISEWEPWIDHHRADIHPEWWGTPLGRLVAAVSRDQHMSIPAVQAALGISRARVYQLLDSGQLQRTQLGDAITGASVAALLARREGTRTPRT